MSNSITGEHGNKYQIELNTLCGSKRVLPVRAPLDPVYIICLGKKRERRFALTSYDSKNHWAVYREVLDE